MCSLRKRLGAWLLEAATSTNSGWDLASYVHADLEWEPGPHDNEKNKVSGDSTAQGSPKQAKKSGAARGPGFV